MLDLWIKQLKKVKEETNEKYEVDEIFVITNDHFFQQFNDWAKVYKIYFIITIIEFIKE